jgi:hypothetical protein
MHDFMHDFGKFASNPHIKHIAHKLTPITDALISKGTEKVQSLKLVVMSEDVKKEHQN